MISIIIPVLNEAETIGTLLSHITKSASAKNILEILIVDGGSTDDTREIVANFSEKSTFNIHCTISEKGRAKQMNTGAAKSTGNILYFLHADSFPPKGFDSAVISEVKQGNLAGCFRMKFDNHHPILIISQWFTRFNYKFCRGGDQSLFVTKKVFNKLNGFDQTYTIYEDCEFINRLYDHYNFKIIPRYVITSSRKYNEIGVWKLQYHFTVVHLKKWMGVNPEKLYGYYRQHIAS